MHPASSQDADLAREILKVIQPNDFSHVRVARLGGRHTRGPRPLRVTLSSKQEAVSILKSKIKYKGPVKIFQDQTPKQRKYLNNLKTKLKELHDSGVTNKTIRFFNGVPKIVDKSFQAKN